jgi:hypothetical protein
VTIETILREIARVLEVPARRLSDGTLRHWVLMEPDAAAAALEQVVVLSGAAKADIERAAEMRIVGDDEEVALD